MQVGAGIVGPPTKMRTGETVGWSDVPYNDRLNNTYDSGSFALTYAFAGPATAAAIVIPAVAGTNLAGLGWVTLFTPIQAALFTPAGAWYWQAILTGLTAAFNGTVAAGQLTVTSGLTGTILPGAVIAGAGITVGTTVVSGSGNSWKLSDATLNIGAPQAMTTNLQRRIIAAEGHLIVEPDLSTFTGAYDGRSTMQIGLANCEAALATWTSSGGPVRRYSIGGRMMEFHNLKELQELCSWFRGRVTAEKMAAAGGDSRNIRIGFSPPTSGIPTSNSKNWPWW